MPPCDTVAKRPLPCVSYESCKMFKISTSEFGTVGMCRQIQAHTDEFLGTETEGVVTPSSFGLIRQLKVSGGKWMFDHCVTRRYTKLRQ